MGVLGLVPFLQKKAPQVFKEFPDRLAGLKGKTIAIDGTLVTQRLHYSNLPHEFRHVLGWYRIIRELQRSGVGIVCVFDGPHRVSAKRRENERRQASRMLTIARESIEVERVARLEQLSKVLESFEALPDSTRQSALEQLKKDVPKAQNLIEGLLNENITGDVDNTIPPPVPASSIDVALPRNDARPQDTAFRIPYRRPVIVHRWVSPYGSLISTPAHDTESITPDTTAAIPSIPDPLPAADAQSVPDSNTIDIHQAKAVNTQEGVQAAADSLFLTADVSESDIEPSTIPAATATFPSISSASPTCPQPISTSTDIDPQVTELHDTPITPEDIQDASDGVILAVPLDTANDVSVGEHLQDDPIDWGFEHLGLRKDEIQSLVSHLEESRTKEPSTAPADDTAVVRELVSLYNDYRISVPKFRIPAQVERKQVVGQAEEAEDRIGEHAMSIFQYDLMLKEGALWNTVATSNASDTAHALHVRSAAIAASYAKRTDFPTERTYEESKMMLRALGVPCLSCNGPHEGEAFASALVHAGVADYVASEDTDVLVYEATLLRGLTSTRNPLTAVSGTEVRETLGLDRSAYVDFALLLGTDFSRRLHRLGPVRALALLRRHGSIEAMLESGAAQPEDREEYMQQIELARGVFNSLPEVSQETVKAAVSSTPDFALVRQLLVDFDLEHAACIADNEDAQTQSSDSHAFGQDFWDSNDAYDHVGDIGTAFFSDDPTSALRAGF